MGARIPRGYARNFQQLSCESPRTVLKWASLTIYFLLVIEVDSLHERSANIRKQCTVKQWSILPVKYITESCPFLAKHREFYF